MKRRGAEGTPRKRLFVEGLDCVLRHGARTCERLSFSIVTAFGRREKVSRGVLRGRGVRHSTRPLYALDGSSVFQTIITYNVIGVYRGFLANLTPQMYRDSRGFARDKTKINSP